ncbi:MAG TPA: hypothetical protein VLZ53_04105, partial [Devosia sp.]|nr:hypothetical protein [Devosia sp.]
MRSGLSRHRRWDIPHRFSAESLAAAEVGQCSRARIRCSLITARNFNNGSKNIGLKRQQYSVVVGQLSGLASTEAKIIARARYGTNTCTERRSRDGSGCGVSRQEAK